MVYCRAQSLEYRLVTFTILCILQYTDQADIHSWLHEYDVFYISKKNNPSLCPAPGTMHNIILASKYPDLYQILYTTTVYCSILIWPGYVLQYPDLYQTLYTTAYYVILTSL